MRDAAALCGFVAMFCGLWFVDWRLALVVCGGLSVVGAVTGHLRG